MPTFIEITAKDAWKLITEQNAQLIDTRDIHAFSQNHPKNAFHLTDATFPDFLQKYDEEQPLIISCYHGISSRNVAQFLIEQGFEEVYSLRGGFDAWLAEKLPTEKSK